MIKQNSKKTSKNHPHITPKSPPKKDYSHPKLQVKSRFNNNIIIIICTAVQLFQEFIILLKGLNMLKGLLPPVTLIGFEASYRGPGVHPGRVISSNDLLDRPCSTIFFDLARLVRLELAAKDCPNA